MKRVLFLCVGNSCRSQMAEGFAKRYGSDVLAPASAGLAPAPIVQPLTKKVMEAKNINIDHQYPKKLDSIRMEEFDVIVNMSGIKLPVSLHSDIRDWRIKDPIGQSEDVYVTVRDQIEHLVMRLILELRKQARTAPAAPSSGDRKRESRRLGP